MYNADNPSSLLSDDDAKAKFDSLDAYTYTTEKNPQTIRVALFCSRGFKTKVIDEKLSRILVHELVHVRLYAMSIAGLTKLPFGEEVEKLHKLL